MASDQNALVSARSSSKIPSTGLASAPTLTKCRSRRSSASRSAPISSARSDVVAPPRPSSFGTPSSTAARIALCVVARSDASLIGSVEWDQGSALKVVLLGDLIKALDVKAVAHPRAIRIVPLRNLMEVIASEGHDELPRRVFERVV